MAWLTGIGPRSLNDAVEVASLDVVHDQEMDAAVFVGVLSGDQVGVLEPAGGLDLAAKPHDGIAVACKRGGQDLERAHAAQAAMPGLEDDAHAALAELVEDQVVADQEPAALLLINRGGLVRRELAGLDQGARKAQHAFGGIGSEGLELGLGDQADLDESARELGEAGKTLRRGCVLSAHYPVRLGSVLSRNDGLRFMDRPHWLCSGARGLITCRHAESSPIVLVWFVASLEPVVAPLESGRSS